MDYVVGVIVLVIVVIDVGFVDEYFVVWFVVDCVGWVVCYVMWMFVVLVIGRNVEVGICVFGFVIELG